MNLSFKTKFDNGVDTHFVEKILNGEKIHTIRRGNRWKVGDKLHMFTGLRTEDCKQFNKDLEGLQVVTSVNHISIVRDKNHNTIKPLIFIDGIRMPALFLLVISSNDGFDSFGDFLDFFKEDFEGQVVHWTNQFY